jgi:hypothetical protein
MGSEEKLIPSSSSGGETPTAASLAGGVTYKEVKNEEIVRGRYTYCSHTDFWGCH